ncbi:extracellular solute-binding protein [Lachnospiraceae bacterium OttesenSCG-928-D06]|nr:extracellular solute-binding protein [Lachnospiraceae bacterium OttesenSCG-928-D06]
MKGKMFLKGIALLVSAGMVAGALSGCGSSQDESSNDVSGTTQGSSSESSIGSSTESQEKEAGYTDYSNGFSERVTIQIPVYDRAFEGWNPTDNYYTRWIQEEFGEKFNVNVQYVAIGRNTEVQDYMQLIAAGNAPDVIMNYDMPQMVNYYSEGAMQTIDLDEVAFYAPNYYEALGETINTYGQLDGDTVFFFAERNAIYYDAIEVVRLDWLEEVGLKLPTNLEERETMGKAWKDAGLGTIGDKLWVQSFTYQYPFITDEDEMDLAMYLDLSIASFTWEPTKEYLRTYNRMYNDGIYDSEFYLNKEDQDAKADFVSGKTGTYEFRISSNTDVISSLLANNPDAKLAVLDPTSKSPDGTAKYYEYPPYGMIMGVDSTTSDEERAALWMFFEWMKQAENLFFLQNGIEGETYTLDADGVAIAISDYAGEAKLSNNMNKDYWCLVQEVKDYGDEDKNKKANFSSLAPEGYEYLVEQSYDYCLKNADQGIITPIFTKSVSSSSEYSADLKAMWQEFYVDCITCAPEEFDDKYEEYCQEYLDGGYQDILDEKMSYIDSGDYIDAN